TKPEEMAIQSCSQWVTRYASHVTTPYEPPNPYPSAQEVEDRLNGLLQLTLVQFIVLGTAVGYATFRLALSNFLRLVSEDSNLWARRERNGLLCVSLPKALTSTWIEIRRFIFQDVIYSLILGLPTLAEYDSIGFPIIPGAAGPINPLDGVHGVPAEMVISITEVHNWRARLQNVDWAVLESRTWAWDWTQRNVQSEESDQIIHRAAILEAWRHSTLIYIRMGVGGVTSHDQQVQASVRQIVKLMGLVGDTELDVHFSVPSIIAGVAARYESQRALIFRKLKTFNGVRCWILRGSDFARVLQYLWCGTAANGAAVGWDEYIQARCEVLPV
ncbi:unnamed protein product, partial [Rhizoctonia solani]